MKPLYTLGLLILSLSSYAQTPTIISNHVITGSCSAVVYGNGICVASCNGIFISSDAKTWTSVGSDTVPSFNFLAFGNGIFVGVAGYASIYTSTDGINWTPRPADVPSIVSHLNFTHGRFYIIGGDAGIIKSDDGINWTNFDLGYDFVSPVVFGGFDYNGSVFVIGLTVLGTRGDPNGGTGVLTSATGEPGSWSFGSVSVVPYIKNVMWLKDRFYLFGEGSMNISTDGITWDSPSPTLEDTLPDGSIGMPGGDAGFLAGDSVYLISVSSVQVSADRIHFKSLNPPNLHPKGGLYVNGVTLIYGDGGLATATDGVHFKLHGPNFTALATNGSGFAAAGWSATGGQLFSSPDFGTWTEQTPASGLSFISTMLYTGTKYVAAGYGNMYFSDDGTSWSNNAVSNNFQSMDYGAGRFVGGSFYKLMTSTDGINWSVVDSNFTLYHKIRYINSNFFAVGQNYLDNKGRILQSADGLHWQDITPSLNFDATYYNDVMYDGTKYYFTGRRQWTDLFTLSTTDPMNTTSYGAVGSIVNPAPGTSAAEFFPRFDDFIYHNGQFVGTVTRGTDGPIYLAYSADGMNWTTTPLHGVGDGRTIVSDGDIYHIVSADGGIYTVSFAGSPLPVTLFDFEAGAVGSGMGENSQLSWRTGSESNSAYFLVQHSLDAVRWDSIGRVTAAGESRVTMSYQFTHVTPPTGANYYRLGMTDQDGQRKWSPVRSVDIGNKGELRLYPNPAKGVVQLQLPGAGPANLVIYNSAGLPVRQQVVSGYSVTLDLRSLTAGIYHLLVVQGEKRYIKEFIIAE